jgi:hypothetical membrane protein
VALLTAAQPEGADINEPARRLAALGGVVGPAAFVTIWGVASITAPRYSASDDAISELAAIGAHTRFLMTAGFICLALGAIPYATALRSVLGGRAWITAAGTGVAISLVAAIPLGLSTATDHFHGIIAIVGYTALGVTPLLAIGPLLVRGSRRLACFGIVTTAVSASALALSDTTSLTGLFQRIGLTAGQIWIVGSALAMALGRLQHRTPERSEPPVLTSGAARADASS